MCVLTIPGYSLVLTVTINMLDQHFISKQNQMTRQNKEGRGLHTVTLLSLQFIFYCLKLNFDA